MTTEAHDVQFEVTIVVTSAPAGMTDEDRALVQSTMNMAKDAALAVLGAAPGDDVATPSLPHSLVDVLTTAITSHRRLAAVRTMAPTGGITIAAELADAVEAFNGAFANLQTTFEQEFPNV